MTAGTPYVISVFSSTVGKWYFCIYTKLLRKKLLTYMNYNEHYYTLNYNL